MLRQACLTLPIIFFILLSHLTRPRTAHKSGRRNFKHHGSSSQQLLSMRQQGSSREAYTASAHEAALIANVRRERGVTPRPSGGGGGDTIPRYERARASFSLAAG